jgi:hypothetical protein
MDGMDKKMRRSCITIYIPSQNPKCLALHLNGEPPRKRRALAMEQVWVQRKSRRSAVSAVE